MLAGAAVIWRFGGAGGATSKMIQPRGGCWQEALVPHCVNLSIGLLECPHNTVASFLQIRESKMEALMPWLRSHAQLSLQHLVGYKHLFYAMWATVQGCEYRRQRLLGALVEDGYHSKENLFFF